MAEQNMVPLTGIYHVLWFADKPNSFSVFQPFQAEDIPKAVEEIQDLIAEHGPIVRYNSELVTAVYQGDGTLRMIPAPKIHPLPAYLRDGNDSGYSLEQHGDSVVSVRNS